MQEVMATPIPTVETPLNFSRAEVASLQSLLLIKDNLMATLLQN
jgi:hypothetical protein